MCEECHSCKKAWYDTKYPWCGSDLKGNIKIGIRNALCNKYTTIKHRITYIIQYKQAREKIYTIKLNLEISVVNQFIF